LSVFNTKPKAKFEHDQMMEARRIEAETVAAREKWEWSHKLALKHQTMASKVPHLYTKG